MLMAVPSSTDKIKATEVYDSPFGGEYMHFSRFLL